MDLQIGWAEFDAASVLPAAAVSWAEFDTAATKSGVIVAWAELDVADPAFVIAPNLPRPVESYGSAGRRAYNNATKQFVFPVDVEPEDEEEVLLAILIEVAAYVLQ